MAQLQSPFPAEPVHLPAGDDPAWIDACDTLLRHSRRHLLILAHHLDPPLLNRETVSSALLAMVRANPMARIQMLIADADQLVQSGHRLLHLSRRLSSFISIRVLAEEHRQLPACWLLGDRRRALWRPDYRYLRQGLLHSDNRRCQQLEQDFALYWAAASSHPALRQLHL